jgi:hypothetical protein
MGKSWTLITMFISDYFLRHYVRTVILLWAYGPLYDFNIIYYLKHFVLTLLVFENFSSSPPRFFFTLQKLNFVLDKKIRFAETKIFLVQISGKFRFLETKVIFQGKKKISVYRNRIFWLRTKQEIQGWKRNAGSGERNHPRV